MLAPVLSAPCPGVRCRYFDAGTRAVLFQMSFYNTNTKQLTNLRMLVEVFMSAQLLPSFEFETAKIVVYESNTDRVRCRAHACMRVAGASCGVREPRREHRRGTLS
jgi:hypothetical protein